MRPSAAGGSGCRHPYKIRYRDGSGRQVEESGFAQFEAVASTLDAAVALLGG